MESASAGPAGGHRLVLVTNREPYSLKRAGRTWTYQKTIGGLVSAMDPVLRAAGGTWVSWGHSQTSAFSGGGEDLKEAVGKPPYRLSEVSLSDKEVLHYYEGYSNRLLWPLFHSFLDHCQFNDSDWPVYESVNRRFAQSTARLSRPSDLVWVHDYQLCLVPQMIRDLRPKQRIGYFLHIPFPPVALFSVLPQRTEILEGLLGADLIGFQSYQDVRNFAEAVHLLLPGKVQVKGSTFQVGKRRVRAMTCPIGIDFLFYKSLAESRAAQERSAELRQEIGCKWVGLGVDRMDYTKGIWRRLQAIDLLLERHPRYRRNFAFLQVTVPSRTKVPEYQSLRDRIELTVGRINGKYRQGAWNPVLYYYRGFNPAELAAYYRCADFALVTPLRDGMNLVSKEYAACSVRNEGSLILSEFTGAARQLKDVWLVNPYNIQQMADTMHQVLSLPRSKVQPQMASLRRQVRREDLNWWVRTFLKELVTA